MAFWQPICMVFGPNNSDSNYDIMNLTASHGSDWLRVRVTGHFLVANPDFTDERSSYFRSSPVIGVNRPHSAR